MELAFLTVAAFGRTGLSSDCFECVFFCVVEVSPFAPCCCCCCCLCCFSLPLAALAGADLAFWLGSDSLPDDLVGTAGSCFEVSRVSLLEEFVPDLAFAVLESPLLDFAVVVE